MNGKIRKRCPICRGNSLSTLQKPERRKVFVTSGPEIGIRIGVSGCKTCGFIFLNPRMSKNDLIDYYSRQSCMPRDIFTEDAPTRKLLDIQINFVEHNRPVEDGALVLEVGCGEAYFLKRMLDRNSRIKVFGVEPSKRCVDTARKLIPSGKFYNDMLKNVDFQKQKFDLVVMRHVLEHLPFPVADLKIISNILKESGRVYIEVPDVSTPVEAANYYFHHEHFSYFSLETLRATLARAGFKVIHAEKFSGNPRNSGFDYPVLRAIAIPGSKTEVRDYPEQPDIFWKYHLTANNKFFEKKLSPVIRNVKAISSQGKKIGLFGAGPHTMDLLGRVRLPREVWEVIFDNDPAKHGGRLGGIPIKNITAESLSGVDAVLVSSWGHEGEMVEQLHKIAPKNIEVLTIYQ